MEAKASSGEEVESKGTPRRRMRLIVRLGALLVAHNVLVSVFCCVAGVVALFLLPILAKTTYISENALMPGSANPAFSNQNIQDADTLIKAIMNQRIMDGKTLYTPRLIAEHMSAVGAEVYYHKFHPTKSNRDPFHFFSTVGGGLVSENSSCSPTGINSVGIIRAPRGDGKESIVMITPYNSKVNNINEVVSLGLAFSIFSHLSQVTWLAKDLVWVAADSQFGDHIPVAAWLADYHNPNFLVDSKRIAAGMCIEKHVTDMCKVDKVKGKISDVFRRAGTVAAGLVIKVVESEDGSGMDSLTIRSEAANGQMPNLDLINIVHYLAVHRQGFRVKVGMLGSLLNSAWLKFFGKTISWLSEMAGSLNLKWKFGIPDNDYVEGTATLLSSMYNQALGIPTGPHGAFRDYQIDAISLEISPRISLSKDIGRSVILLRGGRLIEGVIRSVNNLLEKFHQSFFLYFMTSPNKFVSVGLYMIPFALLIAPLPVVAASLFLGRHDFGGSENSSTTKPDIDAANTVTSTASSWQWIRAARMVFIVHLWAVVVALLPCLIFQMPDMIPSKSMLVLVSTSFATLIFFYMMSGSPYSHANEWQILKAVTITAAAIGLGLMSIINFATAQIGAVFIIPMCLMVQPLRRCKQPLLVLLNMALGLLGFPFAPVFILDGVRNGYGVAGIGRLWELVVSLWSWSSATYLYMLLIHLPCWTLCLHILLHP